MFNGVRKEIGEKVRPWLNNGLVDRLTSASEIAREATVIGQVNIIAARIMINDALQTAITPDKVALLLAVQQDLDSTDALDWLDSNVEVVNADQLAERWAAHQEARMRDMADIALDGIYEAGSRHAEPDSNQSTVQKA